MQSANKRITDAGWLPLMTAAGGLASHGNDKLEDAIKKEQKDCRSVGVRSDKNFIKLSMLHQIIVRNPVEMKAADLIDFRGGIRDVLIMAASFGINKESLGKELSEQILSAFQQEV